MLKGAAMNSGKLETLKLVLISVAVVFAVAAFALTLLKGNGAGAVEIVRTLKIPEQPPPPPLIDPDEASIRMFEMKKKELVEQEIAELKERQRLADEAVAKLRAKYEKDGKLPESIVFETPTSRPKPLDPNQEAAPNTAPLTIYPQEKRVEFEASVMLDRPGQYLPEVLLAGPRGKVHETMLLTFINPYDLWQSLALLGLKQSYTARHRGDMVALEGDRVIIEVEYSDKDSKLVKKRLEDFIYHYVLKDHMPYAGWVYIGSHFVETRDGKILLFAAEAEDIATTWHWPQAIIDNPVKEAGDDTLYCPFEGVVPPKGTKLKVIITPDEEYNSKRPEARPLWSLED
jgi:hypothetical protein